MFSYLPYSQPILNTVFPSSLQVSEGGVSHLFAIDIYFLLHHFTSKLFLTHRMQNTTAAEKMLILHISKTEKRYTENGHQLELSKVNYHVVDVASLCCMEGLDPSRFKSTERFHKTMRITDYFLRRKARENSSISAKEFRMRYEDVLGDCLSALSNTGSRRTWLYLLNILLWNLFLPSLWKWKGLLFTNTMHTALASWRNDESEFKTFSSYRINAYHQRGSDRQERSWSILLEW